MIRNKRRQKEPQKKQDQEQRSDSSTPIASHELREIIHSIGPFPTSNDPLALPEPTTGTNANRPTCTSTSTSDMCSSPSKKAQDRAKARKEYMMTMESNAARDRAANQSKAAESKVHGIRKKAQEKVDNEEDVVKRLQTYSQRAIAFHIRDMQLRDKAVQEEKEREYERRMELAMEADRLREIERREQEEEAKMQKLVEARRVIEDQMSERHQQQLLQEEAKAQENRDMLDQIKRFQLEEMDRAKERREEAARARIEVIRLNEEAAEAKRLERLREKDEDAQILAYQAQQDEILRQREEEERQAELRKKELQKKLLESQSRTLDRRDELDELRARRAAEQKEREFRQKELAEARKRKKDLAILQQAHQQQEEEKRREQQRIAEMRQEEYEGAMRQAREMARREEQEAEIARRKNAQFRLAIQEQILQKERDRKENQFKKFQEGRLRRDMLKEDLEKMETIRGRMVQELEEQGVRPEYFAEMRGMDLERFLSM